MQWRSVGQKRGGAKSVANGPKKYFFPIRAELATGGGGVVIEIFEKGPSFSPQRTLCPPGPPWLSQGGPKQFFGTAFFLERAHFSLSKTRQTVNLTFSLLFLNFLSILDHLHSRT